MTLPDPIHLATCTLSRHVLYELLKVFLLSLTGLTAIWLVGGVVKEGLAQGVPVTHVAALVPYVLPDVLRFTIPVTMLLAATWVYGRMAGFNELIAVKSLGISPLEVLMPALVLGFLLSLVACWLNDVAVSWGRWGIQREVTSALGEIALNMLRTQQSYQFPGRFAISVKDVDGDRLVGVTVSMPGTGTCRGVR